MANGESEPSIKEEQTIQWPMGNQNRKSKKNRQYNGQWGILIDGSDFPLAIVLSVLL
jgi:hypothetical protein